MTRENENQITPLGVGLVLLTAGGVIALVLWRSSAPPESLDTLARIRRTGEVRIGYANEAPYGYLDSATGRITGEAPEIAQVVLRRLGAERIEPVVAEFGSLIPGLKAGRFDVIAAGMYITPERAKEIDFSNPSYAIGEAFLVARGNPLDLHSFEDVAESDDARIGVMGGSVEHGYAKAVGIPPERIVIFPDYPSALGGLRTGRIDAVAATELTAGDLLRKADDPSIERAEPFTNPVIDGRSVVGYGAFGFRKGDDLLQEAFNAALAEFLGTDEHLDLVRPFGFSENTLPGDVTAEDIVAGNAK
ncbi:MAG: ectoine/hydroxyectoine ABC transporter substrate-binding protein EhuB [Planctomycetes bacterium]|nr:ectoine/hydroxyectoine ABC transporter substrate-binding protein EhuB [Planctomycetota bacterium]